MLKDSKQIFDALLPGNIVLQIRLILQTKKSSMLIKRAIKSRSRVFQFQRINCKPKLVLRSKTTIVPSVLVCAKND